MERLVLAVLLLLCLAACDRAGKPESASKSPGESPSATPQAVTPSTSFLKADAVVGVWAAQDEYEDAFNIVLVADGRAISNWSNGRHGGGGERGQWRIVGNEVLIFYRNGWTDRLIPTGDGFRGLGYSMGTNVLDAPADESPITIVNGDLAVYSGVWRLNREPDGTFLYISLQSDGDATSTNASNGAGKWEVTPEGAKVTWADGWTDIIGKQGDQFMYRSWAPKAAATDPPADNSEAVKVGSAPVQVAP